MLGFVLDASSQLHAMAPDCQARGGRGGHGAGTGRLPWGWCAQCRLLHDS